MENYPNKLMSETAIVEAQKQYLSKVYAWMVGGLLLTGVISFLGHDFFASILQQNPSIIWIALLIELGLVIALSAAIHKISPFAAGAMFLGYSFLNGITLSLVFMRYTEGSLYSTFFIAAGMFGAMSVYGFVTKRDLSGMGSFLFMGLIGLIIASIVNIWMQSPMVHWIASIAGVIIFTGLTAYDTQQIKEGYVLEGEPNGAALVQKGAIIGALKLYLDFINLFLMLLRVLGNRR
ncbi:MAG TPA: Bax inhibitor-1/YccA family protein [Patescibacteria group bacterium]|nr:Bax inhibitor-1/YccA family protein [Patescibacteria group bacterium]